MGCASKPSSVPPLDPAMAADLSHLNERELRTVSKLPTFGEEGPDTIRVFISGHVERPGIYYVPQGANGEDLMDLALGRYENFVSSIGPHYIARKNPRGKREQLDFTNLNGGFEQLKQTILRNDDFVWTSRIADVFR